MATHTVNPRARSGAVVAAMVADPASPVASAGAAPAELDFEAFQRI